MLPCDCPFPGPTEFSRMSHFLPRASVQPYLSLKEAGAGPDTKPPLQGSAWGPSRATMPKSLQSAGAVRVSEKREEQGQPLPFPEHPAQCPSPAPDLGAFPPPKLPKDGPPLEAARLLATERFA